MESTGKQHMRQVMTRKFLVGLCSLTLMAALVASQAQARDRLPDFTGLVDQNSPAVVNISSTQSRERGERGGMGDLPEDHPFREFFDRFGGERGEGQQPPQPFDSESLGSGFIISSDGDIVTNYHVVQNADEVVVKLSDRRQYTAEVVGYDERSDLALLNIDAEDLPTVSIGSSTELSVGEWVLAIGSPFGFEHSVTAGIVSAKRRSLPQDNYVPFIQTDVAINPGNSGGPLFNLDGEVVGINSHIYSRSGGFMGLSFAIPVELAMDVIDQLRTDGRVARGWLGVLIQDVDRDLAESFGMDRPHGALVAQVTSDSPAADADLEAGDVIVRFEGQDIGTSSELPPMVGRMRADAEVTLEIIRDGEHREVTVTLGELPDEMAEREPPQQEMPEEPEPATEYFGMELRDLSEQDREERGIDQAGVLVERLTEGPAQQSGIRQGDVITMLDQQRVDSVETFESIAEGLEEGRVVPVLLMRNGSPRFLPLRLP
ncbi:serine protease Do [Aquisalimonas asiatica]|uniref:Probable periplasmic serine endoprotease DegP-like n=2 Tax=Aquisalimonas asiatica TaxID=406100 RepID=A0A1H8QC83_9GAMM|nr:serine protease Do [Aquisalimonas asiatica]